jgi:hypothetical protein
VWESRIWSNGNDARIATINLQCQRQTLALLTRHIQIVVNVAMGHGGDAFDTLVKDSQERCG